MEEVLRVFPTLCISICILYPVKIDRAQKYIDHNSWKISCFPTNSLYRPNIFSSFSHSPFSHGNWISCS